MQEQRDTSPDRRSNEQAIQSESAWSFLKVPILFAGMATCVASVDAQQVLTLPDPPAKVWTDPNHSRLTAPGGEKPAAEKPAKAEAPAREPIPHEFESRMSLASIERYFDNPGMRARFLPKTDEAKSDMGAYLDRYLTENPPKSYPEHLRWQRYMAVYRHCDPCASSCLEEASVKHIESFLKMTHAWEKAADPFRSQDGYVRVIHQIYGALSEEGQQKCSERIGQMETALAARKKEALEYIDRSIKFASDLGLKERATSETAITVGASVPFAKHVLTEDLRGKLDGAKGFSLDDKGRWIFREEDKKANWVLELDRIVPVPAPYTRHLTLRSADTPGMFITVSEPAFLANLGREWIGRLTAEARKGYESEQKGEKLLNGYDLPKEGKMTLLRIYPENHDYVVTATIQSSMLLAGAMKERYGARLDAPPIKFVDSPRDAIIEAIRAEMKDKKGSRFFCIELNNHGLPGYVAFRKPLTAHDVADIANAFPECKFAYTTIACFGGGLQPGFSTQLMFDPSLKDRVSIFTQTKPYMENHIATVREGGGMMSHAATNYNLHLIKALYDPKVKTFGEAVRKADLATKEYKNLDGESIVDGELIGRAPSARRDDDALPV